LSGRHSAPSKYRPNAQLLASYAPRYRWDQAKLDLALREFGPLPNAGQTQLLDLLIEAWGRCQWLARNVRHTPPSKLRDQLATAVTTSGRLLRAFGVDVQSKPPRSVSHGGAEIVRRWRLHNRSSGLDIPICRAGLDLDRDLTQVNVDLRRADAFLTETIKGVLWLHNQASLAMADVKSSVLPRGVSARKPIKQKGRVARDATRIYCDLRQKYPKSGHTPGYGGPLCRFVRAVGTLFGCQIDDQAIKEAWRKVGVSSKKNF
jgi:hypothetical protein